jgi:hypothetical protein
MKKLLLMVVVLAGCLALVGTVFAANVCAPVCKPPVCKPAKPAVCPKTITIPEVVEKKVRAETVLCKGATKGQVKLCGPCAPTIKYAVAWKTAELGKEKVCKYLIVKKGKLLPPEKPVKEAAYCW